MTNFLNSLKANIDQISHLGGGGGGFAIFGYKEGKPEKEAGVHVEMGGRGVATFVLLYSSITFTLCGTTVLFFYTFLR